MSPLAENSQEILVEKRHEHLKCLKELKERKEVGTVGGIATLLSSAALGAALCPVVGAAIGVTGAGIMAHLLRKQISQERDLEKVKQQIIRLNSMDKSEIQQVQDE